MAEIVEDVGVTDVDAMLRVCKVFGRHIDFFKADRLADIALRWSAREPSYPVL